MDYEVFLVTRVREAWDAASDNDDAVAHGLERTGRIITAAALIMVAAFSGFVAAACGAAGSSASVSRSPCCSTRRSCGSILVPVADGVFGRWNWWLPPEGREGALAHAWATCRAIYLTIVIARRIAGSWYPSARPGTSRAYVRTGTIPYGVFAYDGCCV